MGLHTLLVSQVQEMDCFPQWQVLTTVCQGFFYTEIIKLSIASFAPLLVEGKQRIPCSLENLGLVGYHQRIADVLKADTVVAETELGPFVFQIGRDAQVGPRLGKRYLDGAVCAQVVKVQLALFVFLFNAYPFVGDVEQG